MEPQQHTRTQTPPPVSQQLPPQQTQAPTGAAMGGNPLHTPITPPLEGRPATLQHLSQYGPGTIGHSYGQVVSLFNMFPTWFSGNARNLHQHISDPSLHPILSRDTTGMSWSERGALTDQLADRDRDGLMDPGNDAATHRATRMLPHPARRFFFNAFSAQTQLPPRDWSEPPDQD
jgi:hypothetical protein